MNGTNGIDKKTPEVQCTCIFPNCERQLNGLGPADYCQKYIAAVEVLAEMERAGELERVPGAPGHYRATSSFLKTHKKSRFRKWLKK